METNKIPGHMAIILDGNGRWAAKRKLPRTIGHRKGAENIKTIAKLCQEKGIRYLTLFCFSTENWTRPKEEVRYLMTTPIRYYQRYKTKLWNSDYRFRFLGRRDRLSEKLLEIMTELEEKTKTHTGLTISICIDYGSYDELTSACKKIAEEVKQNQLNIDDITPNTIEQHLFTKDYPPLDFLIRTSGEIRISNFLLWQLAYAELYFTDVLWPDFDQNELEKALNSYQMRKRRFGGLHDHS